MLPAFAGSDVINRRCRHSITAGDLNYRNMKGTKRANFHNVVVIKFRETIRLSAMVSDWNMKDMIRMVHILFRRDGFQVPAAVVRFLSIPVISFCTMWKPTEKRIYHQSMNQVLSHLSIFAKCYKRISSGHKAWLQQ